MPIYQADLDHGRPDVPARGEPEPSPSDAPLKASDGSDLLLQRLDNPERLKRLSSESLPAHLCEGPIPDSPARPDENQREEEEEKEGRVEETATSDRSELIERLKRGQSPTWIPKPGIRQAVLSESGGDADAQARLDSFLHNQDWEYADRHPSLPSRPLELLPPAPITPEKTSSPPPSIDIQPRDPLSPVRPPSALHTGDFTHHVVCPSCERDSQLHESRDERHAAITTATDDYISSISDRRSTLPAYVRPAGRSAASPLSSSVSSSFAYHPPTSPLVQSESNDDPDFTMPARSLDTCHFSTFASASHHWTHVPSPFLFPPIPASPCPHSQRRQGAAMAYQAHQPRRSLTTTTNPFTQATFSQTLALPRSRRPSLSGDASPIQQHASMVGSYEESILRGRMSTTPSKPFDFLVQIGVLGKGKCRPGLRCPPHVTLPFPAVFYSYGATPHGRSRSDDGPSPYVGQIDLENGLPNPDEVSRSKKKVRARYLQERPSADSSGSGRASAPGSGSDGERHRAGVTRTRRPSRSPKAPPGGSYRIPEKGHVQIVIKNQNKTAVKLFLVPYDLTGMEPGTKTFIRQRSYSAGPVIDNVPNAREQDSMSRPMLRYLVNLHICCPSKGRFYLYRSIRVVFANRVPEGKEKLQNETTWPEPRFTPYKPIRAMHRPLPTLSGPGAMLAVDKALRRRSLGVAFGGALSSGGLDAVDGLWSGGGGGGGNALPVDVAPFGRSLVHLGGRSDESDDSGSTKMTTTDAADEQTTMWSLGSSSPQVTGSRPSTGNGDESATAAGSSSDPSGWVISRYDKLAKGDTGYGGLSSGGGGVSGLGIEGGGGTTEGLLSQRLRLLGVKARERQHR